MFDLNPSQYRNYLYGVVTKTYLQKVRQHVLTLWNEDLILYWNDGEVRCFKNFCPHIGLPLDQGKIEGNEIVCGYHSWRFRMSDGSLTLAPLAKKKTTCKLAEVKTFVYGGVVYVYPGEPEHFEKAKKYLPKRAFENQSSARVTFDVPFYLALNSAIDYPHFERHRMFYRLYTFYRAASFRKNPMRVSFTPVMLEETDAYFKYKNTETEMVYTVRPFCVEQDDPVSLNRWQVFVLPVSENRTEYMVTVQPESKNVLHRMVTRACFYTAIKWGALPEDCRWLKTSFRNWTKDKHLKLCEQDFGLKHYLKKFVVHPVKF